MNVPGWAPGAAAAAGVIGAFAFGMWLLGKASPLSELTSRYKTLIDVSQEPSGMVLVRFVDDNGKEQVHDWFFDGKDWRCGLTGET